jgi:hypothetical protein
MAPRNIFRSTVALSLVLAIITAVAGQFPGNISEDWKTLLEWSGNEGIFEYVTNNLPKDLIARIALFLALFVFLAFTLFVQVGMFLFWRFARLGYVVLTGIFVLMTAFDGLVVTLPAQEALYELALLLDGAVIAMSYLNPISGYFEQRNV